MSEDQQDPAGTALTAQPVEEQAGAPAAPQATVDLPAASVREVPAPPAQKKPRYRYVVRAVQAFHIWEEKTGRRITAAPLASQVQAEEHAAHYNQQQAPPI